jgi:hypothetical protein
MGVLVAGRTRSLGDKGPDVLSVRRHHVVIATQDAALPLLSTGVCVPAASRLQGQVAEFELDSEEGRNHRSAGRPRPRLSPSAGSGERAGRAGTVGVT